MSSRTKKYFEGVGRRKTAVARVRIMENEKKKGEVLINDKYSLDDFFSTAELMAAAKAPLETVEAAEKFYITIRVQGGGQRGQSDAVKLGLARALVKYNGDWHKELKDQGFLKRDPRAKERKKPGLKKARRAPQWSKR